MWPLLRCMRPQQWVKNGFLFLPLVFSQTLNDSTLVVRAALGFVAFCALSSCVYLFNDVGDRERDRLHPLKRRRPIASGQLSARTATMAALALGLGGLVLGWSLSSLFGVIAAVYIATNLLYSFWLKQVVIVDVMIVAAGFVLRILAGGAAIEVPVSTWLILCTTFLSLFLAFSKRRHELTLLSHAASQREVLDHYSPAFLDQMINVVTASTLLSYALYATADETAEKFGTPYLILTLPFVLFGIFRYLYLIYQVDTERNPTEAMLHDRPFLFNLGCWGLTVVLVIYQF